MEPLPPLDPDEKGNALLQHLVSGLHCSDRASFVEKLTKQPLRERFHTYRELLLGAQLRTTGADFRYEKNINGKTPDWTLSIDGKLVEIIDVVTLHQRNQKEIEITTATRSTNSWSGWISVPAKHIYRKLSDKSGQYSELARNSQTPFVIAVFGDFLAAIDPNEIDYVLYKYHEDDWEHKGWFPEFPEVSGLIYFREKNGDFEFIYFPNPHALYPATWSSRVAHSPKPPA